MKKTGLLEPYLKKIDSLNDQLWYFLFTTEELNNIITGFSPAAQLGYTTDLFFKNPFSKRLHIKVSDLIGHQNNNKRLTFGSYFSTCYEIASNYIRDVFDELKSCNRLTKYNWGDGKKPEVKLKNLLTTHGISLPPSYIIDSFTYFRLRRNYFTHLNSTPNAQLTSFITSTGASLNGKWKSPGSKKKAL